MNNYRRKESWNCLGDSYIWVFYWPVKRYLNSPMVYSYYVACMNLAFVQLGFIKIIVNTNPTVFFNKL